MVTGSYPDIPLLQEDEDSVLTKNKKRGGDGELEIDVVTVQPIRLSAAGMNHSLP